MNIRGNMCHCNTCGKTFGGLSLFDWHRIGKFTKNHPDYGRVCRNSYHLALHGAVLKAGVWREPMSEAIIALKQKTKAQEQASQPLP